MCSAHGYVFNLSFGMGIEVSSRNTAQVCFIDPLRTTGKKDNDTLCLTMLLLLTYQRLENMKIAVVLWVLLMTELSPLHFFHGLVKSRCQHWIFCPWRRCCWKIDWPFMQSKETQGRAPWLKVHKSQEQNYRNTLCNLSSYAWNLDDIWGHCILWLMVYIGQSYTLINSPATTAQMCYKEQRFGDTCGNACLQWGHGGVQQLHLWWGSDLPVACPMSILRPVSPGDVSCSKSNAAYLFP